MYRYPDANRCGEIAFLAEETFRKTPQAGLLLTKWTKISACTLLTGLVSIKLPSRLKLIVGIISTIFFLVKCLPNLLKGAKEIRTARESEERVYREASALIDEIFTNFSIQTLKQYLPASTFNKPGDTNVINPSLQITQELIDGLDRFINEKLRIFHNWNRLKAVWNANPRATQFVNTPAGQQRFLVDQVFSKTSSFTSVLKSAVDSINQAKKSARSGRTNEFYHTLNVIVTNMRGLEAVQDGRHRNLELERSISF